MKWKKLLIGLCAILAIIIFFVIYKASRPAAKPAVDQPKIFTPETAMLAMFDDFKIESSNHRYPLDNLTILRFALSKHGLDQSNWKAKGKRLSAKNTEGADHDGHTIHMKETISIANSGFSPDGNVYAALIEKANEAKNDPDGFAGMELDSYTCDLLVLRKNFGKWKVDFFGQVDESQYSGGSRGARSCGDGYRLMWKNGRPAFVDKPIISGPYTGGYSTAVLSIDWNKGKYQLESIILYEGYGHSLIANFSVGKQGDNGYEHLSFHTNFNEPGKITYSYGKQNKEIRLTYLGADTLKGLPCFKVRFPNKFTLYMIPKDRYLEVISLDGSYSKRFKWDNTDQNTNDEDDNEQDENEPADNNVLDEAESMAMIRAFFTK